MTKVLKKAQVYLLILVMLVTMILPTATASATTTDAIAVGSYVQFGSYYGQPILWRVINQDANGTMIFMDKIIGVKAFDATGDLTDGRGDANRQSNGSNYWEKSNLREWFNSNSASVTFSHQVPDAAHVWSGYSPYSTEAGFLTNLTTNEQNAINPVTHKALVTSFDQTVADGGSVLHTYNDTNPSTSVQNYTTAYYKNITDKIFSLSIKELNDYVYSNATLGDGATYYMTKPTAAAISNTTYTNAGFNTSSIWYYWTRDAYTGNASYARYVHPSGAIYDCNASNGTVGLRGALYLKSGLFTSGIGTSGSPYVLLPPNTAPTISITTPSTAQIINASGTVTISGTVTDPDASQTETISATINGVPKSTTVASPTADGAWSLLWTGAELAEGSYPADITVTASDGTDTGTATYTGDIIVDNTIPTVNASTSISTQNTSITAQANATDSTTMQYLFNKDGVDQGTWQAGNTYNFTGLTANTAYVIKYKAKDAAGNTSGYSAVLNVTTTSVPGPLVGTVTMMELRDLTNNDNASDIRVLFRGAINESNIASYKIIVSKGTIDEATASGLPVERYMSLRKKGNLRLYLTCLPTALKSSSGDSINSAEGEYNVYVLSVGKTGYSDKLSTPLSITIITNNAGKKITVSTPTVSDSASNGNGTDLKVSFRKPKSEANIESYRIIASTTDLTLTTAQDVLAGGYTSFTPTATGISYIKIMGSEQKDNGGTTIQNGTAYKVYVLAIGKNGYDDVLSSASKSITLSQYVPGTNAVRSLRAVKAGSGHDSANIRVSFYEPISVSNVQEYRVFISPSGSTLDQSTADGISNAVLYQVVATTGRGKSHTVTLDTGKKDYSDAALAAGNYKVYVLAVGKAGYAGKLSVASGNVTLD